VRVGGEIVGAINFGYGSPPQDEETLQELAQKYQLPIEQLRKQARAYLVRPNFIIDYAKSRIRKAAVFLGEKIERNQSEKALYESRENLRAIIESSPLAIIGIASDGTVLNWNPAAEEMFGWSAGEVLGKYLPIVNQEQMKGFHTLLDSFSHGDSVSQLESERTRKDGSTLLVNISTALIHDKQGNLSMIVGILDDITERKQVAEMLRSTSESFQAIQNHSPLLISEIALDGRYLRVNQALAEVYGKTHSEIVEKLAKDFLTPDAAKRFMSRIALVAKILKPITIEDTLTLPIGKRTFLTTLFPLFHPDGTIRSVGAIAHDITDRKESEEKLNTLKENLELEVREKTAQLQDRVAELENFYETTIEREFRIKELKEIIEQLENKKS